MTRKVLTIYGAFHRRSDVDRLYVSRVNGGQGLISCEGCVRSEENSLGWYTKNSLEVLLQGVRATSLIVHFTVVCLVTWAMNESEAGVDLVLIEPLLLFLRKFLLISMPTTSLT